jgi:hypothetical protein
MDAINSVLDFFAEPKEDKIQAPPVASISADDEAGLEAIESARDTGFEKLVKLGFEEAEIMALFGLEPPQVRLDRRERERASKDGIAELFAKIAGPILNRKKR